MKSKIDRAALAAAVSNLQGLTSEQKSALLELINDHKKYGLVWEDKPEDVKERLRDELPILREVKDRAIISDAPDAPNHVLIEGDNLEALTALSYTHEGRIDVIYIDPPYNTGNKDFVYNDQYVDSEDSYRHSKWLSFMNKRLKIAKRLLSDRGVIFISIDDNEQAQLKLLCDEVFGQNSFVSSVIWQKKTGAADAKGLAVITEYILVYCRKIEEVDGIFAKNNDAFDIKRYKYKDNYYAERGPFYFDSLDRGSVRYSDSLNYPIYAPDGTVLYPNDRNHFANDGWTWKWSKDKIDWGLRNGFIDIAVNPKKKCGWSVRYKIYLNVDNEGNLIKKSAPYKNLIQDVLNADAANDIKLIFDNKIFNFPKPLKLILQLLQYIENRNSTILDFFAGSGTTLHATMQLNAEDGGHRQCILVTNNENGICENVTYERNKRVICGYTTPKGQQVEGLKENNLRYYKIDSVPREQTATNKRQLMEVSTDLLCIKHNLYDEKNTFFGLKLPKQMARYFEEQGRGMLIIYLPDVIPYIVKALAKANKIAEPIQTYVACDGAYPFTDDFHGVLDRVELHAMPYSLYQAYRQVLPPKSERQDFADLPEVSEKELNEADANRYTSEDHD